MVALSLQPVQITSLKLSSMENASTSSTCIERFVELSQADIYYRVSSSDLCAWSTVTEGVWKLVPSLEKWFAESFVLNFEFDIQVVSRGGFHLGNGINWKGQVFPKMRNHTSVNKMTVSIFDCKRKKNSDLLLHKRSGFNAGHSKKAFSFLTFQ